MFGALIGAGAGLLGSIVQGKQSRKNIQAQIRGDKELAEYAYSKDLEMWQRQNEYNAPTAQMARLQEAGLNPKLVYGSGSVAGNTAGQMPKYQSVKTDFSKRKPPIDIPMMLSMLGAYQNVEGQHIRNDISEQLLRQEQMKTANLATKIPVTITGPTGNTKVVMNRYMDEMYNTQLDVQKATLRKLQQDAYRTGVLGDIGAIRRDYEEWMQGLGVGGKGLKITGDLWKLLRGK